MTHVLIQKFCKCFPPEVKYRIIRDITVANYRDISYPSSLFESCYGLSLYMYSIFIYGDNLTKTLERGSNSLMRTKG